MYMTSISYVSAGVQMPDVLNFCQGEIKLSWISTELYSKAAKLLARHEGGMKMYHRDSSGDYYELCSPLQARPSSRKSLKNWWSGMYHYISYTYHVCIRVSHITLHHDI